MSRRSGSRIAPSSASERDALIARAVDAWCAANRQIGKRGSRKGPYSGYRGVTADSILEAAGVRFKSDPHLWCAYEREIREQAVERLGRVDRRFTEQPHRLAG